MMKEKGFSLVEVVIVIIMAMFLLLLVVNIPSLISSITKSRHSSIAKDIISQQMDYLKKTGVDNLSNGTYPFTQANLSELSYTTASYTVADCPANICTHDEDIKQVTVSVTWQELGSNESAQITTFMVSGGVGQ